jgi:hypothetical protein
MVGRRTISLGTWWGADSIVLEVTPHFTSSAFSTYLGQPTLGRAGIVIMGVALGAGGTVNCGWFT